MTIVYLSTALIFLLSFLTYMIAAWKHPYFNIGKEESGKNGVFIRNMLSIGSIVVYMFTAINVGKFIDSNGFLYVTLGYLMGVLLGNAFTRFFLNQKYKDVVYEKYSVKKAREAMAAEAQLQTETAPYAPCNYDDSHDAHEEKKEENPIIAAEEPYLERQQGFPPPPDHRKDRPWD